MKLTKYLIILFIGLFLNLSMVGAVSAQSGFNIMGIENFNSNGDFFEIKVEASDSGTGMTGNYRIELTGSETTNVNDKTFDCCVMKMKGEGEMSSLIASSGDWTMDGKIYLDKNTMNHLKSTMTMDISMEYLGEKMSMETETTSIVVNYVSTQPKNPKIGDIWNETTKTQNTANSIMNGINIGSDNDTDEITKIFEYIEDKKITTELGTFNCRVIKSYEEDPWGFNDEYTLNYYDKDLDIPIKFEEYDNDEVETSGSTVAYRIMGKSAGKSEIGSLGGGGGDSTDEDDDSKGGLLGLGTVAGIDVFMLLLVVIIIVVILVVVMVTISRRKRATVSGSQQGQYQYQSQAQQYQPQTLYQPQTQYQPPQQQQTEYKPYSEPPQQVQVEPQQQYQSQSSYDPTPSSYQQYQSESYSQPTQQQSQQPPTYSPGYDQYSTKNVCQYCNDYLEFNDQYQRWYCNTCRQYR